MPSAAPSARFRQRKISVKQTLSVVRQSDIPDLEEEQQRELQQIETGVEKAEEEEHHLKAAINASNAASSGAKVAQVYIPTPDASKKWDEYAKFYKGEFNAPATYVRTSATVEDTAGCSYCMDEEDEEFLEKMNANAKVKCTEDEFEMICDKFETVVSSQQPFLSMDPSQLMPLDELTEIITKQIQEAENDPSSPEYLLLNMSTSAIMNPAAGTYTPLYRQPQVTSPNGTKTFRSLLSSFNLFSAAIYPHWKDRKIGRQGKTVFPILKFEDNAEKDDNDPYVCFRRREIRQVRKTRRTDMQSSERLRKLQAEMETVKKLVEMVVKREQLRKDALRAEYEVFERRCKIKTVKRALGIKGDDEDLVSHKKKKVEEKKPAPPVLSKGALVDNKATDSSKASVSMASGNSLPPTSVRLPASKIPDMDLLTLEQVLVDKETAIRNAVKGKLKARSVADREWVNYTDNPFVPYCDYFDPGVDRRALSSEPIMDPKYAAYSSIASSYPPPTDMLLKLPLAASLGSSYSSRVEVSPIVMKTQLSEDGELDVVSKITEKEMAPTGSYNVPRFSSVSLRKRYGRGGRLLVDRRGLIRRPNYEPEEMDAATERLIDRYKYDSENHSDNMEFSFSDPCRLNGISESTQSIRFGAMLLSKAYESYRDAYQQRQQQLLSLQQKVLQQQAQAQQQQQVQSQQSQQPGTPGQLQQHQIQQLQQQQQQHHQIHNNQQRSSPAIASNVLAGNRPQASKDIRPTSGSASTPKMMASTLKQRVLPSGTIINRSNQPSSSPGPDRVVSVPKVEANV